VAVRCVAFGPGHLDAVVALCEAEGWPSLPADRGRAERALQAPGVTTLVALDDDAVVGFATMLSDGEIQAYLSLLVVARGRRGQGLGRRLVAATFAEAGGIRVDLLAEPGAEGFYEAMQHRTRRGYRLYPEVGPAG
jgi:GNAT superfamily N-acetyltransferase